MENRIYGFDIIRTVSFFAIYIFHLSITTFNTPEITASYFSSVAYVLEAYARTFSVSGFTIIFLTCFLMAFRDTKIKTRLRLFVFMFLAWVLFQILITPAYDAKFGWDVYPLILFSISICLFLRLISHRLIYLLSALGFFMLFIPFWELREYMPTMNQSWQNILGFADCNKLEVDEWPILPWAGICWLAYGIGMKTSSKWKNSSSDLKVSKIEAIMWLSIFLVSKNFYGPMYNVSLGYDFSCSMYRFPPAVFWAHFVWPLFFIRISLDDRVQKYLSSLYSPRVISNFTMNQHFWLSYFLNFIVCFYLGHFYRYYLGKDGANIYWLVPLCFSIGFPLSETMAFLTKKIFARFITARSI